MAGITISGAVRSNLLALQNITSQQNDVQSRLGTGKKVNSALDNATTFFTAASFTSRAGSLTSLLDSVSNGIQALKAADTGIGSINKLVEQLKSTAQQALQSSPAYTAQASYSSTAITGAKASDLRGAGNATTTGTAIGAATGTTLLSAAPPGVVAGDTFTVNGTTITAVASGATGDQVNVGDALSVLLGKIATAAGTGATATIAASRITVTAGDTSTALTLGGTGITKLGLTAGTQAAGSGVGTLDAKVLTFTVGTGTPLAITLGDPATTPGSVKSLDDLNTKLSSIGLSASLDQAGKLSFTTTSQTASQSFRVRSNVAAAGFTTTDANSTAPVRGGAGADTRDSLVTQYNGLLAQVDSIAKDSSFNGLNLLAGDTLSLIFNETNTSRLDVQGTSATFTGIGLSTVSATNFNDGGGINKVLASLEAAKTSLQSTASKFGASLAVVQTRQDFTKQTINTLNAGADNLTSADLNEEATNLLALNTSQQLALQALSLSNQTQQGVLRLLG